MRVLALPSKQLPTQHLGPADFRYALHLRFVGASVEQETRTDAGWVPVRWWSFQLRLLKWGLGHDHFYYDGNWCGFVLGPIHFGWRTEDHCKRCRPEDA